MASAVAAFLPALPWPLPEVERVFRQGVPVGEKALRFIHIDCMDVRRKTPTGFK